MEFLVEEWKFIKLDNRMIFLETFTDLITVASYMGIRFILTEFRFAPVGVCRINQILRYAEKSMSGEKT